MWKPPNPVRVTVVVAALTVLLPGCGGDSPRSPIRVLSPNGGESWEIGAIESVTWRPGSYSGSVDIDLSTDGGNSWTALAANTPNDGSESVTVPATATHRARVRVGAADGDPANELDPSDASNADLQIGGPPVDALAGLPGVYACSQAWGDYDGDGDLDLVLAGFDGSTSISRIYRNDAGTFIDIGAGLPGVSGCSLAWGDYDKDGDLDLALAGSGGDTRPISNIYRNDAGTFVDILADLTGLGRVSLAWGDYDNDGDLDLAISGDDGAGASPEGFIYRNDAGAFVDITAGLKGVFHSSLAWGDYDNDGDLDLALAGDPLASPNTRIYRNDAGIFTDGTAGLPGLNNCSLAWGDYDNDGDLDLALAGSEGFNAPSVSQIYRNDEGGFTDIVAGLPGVGKCSLAWGDYDNDGDLDLALAGSTDDATRISRIYRNDGGMFIDVMAGLTGVDSCSLAWGDYDDDGDLDLALSGNVGDNTPFSAIYRNDGGFTPNTRPSAPTDVTALAGGGEVLLSWASAMDVETPREGLSYNLRVGWHPNDDGSYASMADGLGLRAIPSLGPIAMTLSATENYAWLTLPPGVYYASVQAIDTTLEGGPWSDLVFVVIP